MPDNPVWEICERVAEVQALLDDHIGGGKHSAADVVAKAQAVGARAAAGDVRCRLLPAEQKPAAAMPLNGLKGGRTARPRWATFCRTRPQQKQRAISPSAKSAKDPPVGA